MAVTTVIAVVEALAILVLIAAGAGWIDRYDKEVKRRKDWEALYKSKECELDELGKRWLQSRDALDACRKERHAKANQLAKLQGDYDELFGKYHNLQDRCLP